MLIDKPTVEVVRLVEIPEEEVSKAVELLTWALRELGIPSEGLTVYITDDHNRVREALGLEVVKHEEWPIKYMRIEDEDAISIIPNKLLALSDDERAVMALREVALVEVMNNPTLISIWNPPPNIGDPAIHRVSLALLRRTVDLVIAKSEPLVQYLARAFNGDEVRNLLLTCQPTIDCATAVLALDVPLSIEVAGNRGLGRSLWDAATRGLGSEFFRGYDDFRDFVRNNFNVENTYNYLVMMFRRS